MSILPQTSNKLQVVLQEPAIPDTWDYRKSVEKVKSITYKWKNLTEELANELWIAREKLSSQGERTDLGTLVPKLIHTWSNYCHDIGNSRQVVNRWLSNWFVNKKDIKELEDRTNYKQLPNGIEIYNEDFRTHKIEENTIDLIITDPPYPEEYLDLWGDLSLYAYQVLKPSGYLVAYSGQYFLPRVMLALSEHLEYYWTMAITLPGGTQIVNGRNVMCGWKPILVYQKPPLKKKEKTFYDVVISPGGEKELHEWQQSEGGVAKLIETFSNRGDIIVDPFSGAGTFPLVGYKMERKAIGLEIDKVAYLKSKERILNDKT